MLLLVRVRDMEITKMANVRDTANQLKQVLDRIAANKDNQQMVQSSITEAKRLADQIVQESGNQPQTGQHPNAQPGQR